MKLSEKQSKRLRERYGDWALVTGASSGIGMELARLLAGCGFNLLISGRNEEQLIGLSNDLSTKNNVRVELFCGDLSERNTVLLLLEKAEEFPVGLFIACAGYGTSGFFVNNEIGVEVNMLHVNVECLLIMTHHFAGKLAKQKKGGIILMSSMVAFQGVPYSANYGATKAYVQSLAEGITEELKPFNVDVLAAAPGPVASGFGKRANMNMTMSLSPSQVGIPILKALGKKRTVLPGSLTKLLVYALRTVPRWAKIKIMKNVMKGFTKHQLES